MDIGVISVRYARALIKAALGMKLEDQVYQEMQTLFKSYIDVPELRFTIDNPMLSKDKKEALLITALGKEPTELSKKFIALVLKEDRESTLQFMAASYITLYRKQKNIIRGKLITATAVDASTEDKMRKMVEQRTKGTVEFKTEVNPELIGGFILEYDTYRMDASVKTKLNNILTQLKKVKIIKVNKQCQIKLNQVRCLRFFSSSSRRLMALSSLTRWHRAYRQRWRGSYLWSA